jgi:hypothetical protein
MSNIVPATTVKTVAVDGIEVFYREAGDQNAPVILLLHGFPTSSFQYRNLITRLALQYRVIVSFFRSPNIYFCQHNYALRRPIFLDSDSRWSPTLANMFIRSPTWQKQLKNSQTYSNSTNSLFIYLTMVHPLVCGEHIISQRIYHVQGN